DKKPPGGGYMVSSLLRCRVEHLIESGNFFCHSDILFLFCSFQLVRFFVPRNSCLRLELIETCQHFSFVLTQFVESFLGRDDFRTDSNQRSIDLSTLFFQCSIQSSDIFLVSLFYGVRFFDVRSMLFLSSFQIYSWFFFRFRAAFGWCCLYRCVSHSFFEYVAFTSHH